MNDRERIIKLTQEAVGGCARHWAALIADKLIDSGFEFVKKTPIESLNLSVRTYHAVKRAGIDTVEELRSWDKDLLARCRGVGVTAIAEIEQALQNYEEGRKDAEEEATVSAQLCTAPSRMSG